MASSKNTPVNHKPEKRKKKLENRMRTKYKRRTVDAKRLISHLRGLLKEKRETESGWDWSQ